MSSPEIYYIRKIYGSASLVILLLLLLCGGYSAGEETLRRQKRYLYFPNGGTFKLVLGFAVPVPLGLKQSMGWGWNFQFQYPLPVDTNSTRVYPPIIASRKKRQEQESDRSLAYKGVEALLDKNGLDGKNCLLRSICENAMESTFHEANGLWGHLLHIFLAPDYGDGNVVSDLDPSYMDAKKAGQYGVDCVSLYPECSKGDGILDFISHLAD